MGPEPQYLARYNGYILPGYVQAESSESITVIGNHQAPYADASLSEHVGIQNKNLTLRLKIWECTFDEAREMVQKAATILRTNRETFVPLYVQFPDRYYESLVTKISSPKEVLTSLRTREYTAEFEAKPWLKDATVNTITGNSGILQTTGRTLDDGGWTPLTIMVTGTNVTVSGYTSDGTFTGFMSITGAVTNFIVESESLSAYVTSGQSLVNQMAWADFGVYVGPGETFFNVTGASSIQLQYQNRWYI